MNSTIKVYWEHLPDDNEGGNMMSNQTNTVNNYEDNNKNAYKNSDYGKEKTNEKSWTNIMLLAEEQQNAGEIDVWSVIDMMICFNIPI